MLRKETSLLRYLVIPLFALTLMMAMCTVTSAQNTCAISKWIQLPDETKEGIDIRMDQIPGISRRLLADDFLCEQTGPITCIKFWGSWDKDSGAAGNISKGTLESIHLSIHADVPVGADPAFNYSHPLQPALWQMDFGPTSFTETLHLDLCPDPTNPNTCSWEGFWDPAGELTPPLAWGDTYVANADSRIWLYTVNIPELSAFVQEGTAADPIVYWLDINVLIKDEGDGVVRSFGWKTSIDNWNDNAVYDINGNDWAELMYPPGFINPAKIDEQIDLAFEINTTQPSTPLEACCYKDGTCTMELSTDCIANGGNPQGLGSDCTTVQCPVVTPVTEACCYIDAAGNMVCDDLTLADCLVLNGTPQGAGTDCSNPNIQCVPTPVTEACCLPNGNCVDLIPAVCLAHNGTPQGPGNDCSTVNCPQPCVPAPVTCQNTNLPALGMSLNTGSHDDFTALIDAGAAPVPVLLNYINNCSSPGTALQLNQVPGVAGVPANSWFGHTFTGLPFGIVSATLEIRARASNGAGAGGAFNDTISIVDNVNATTCVGTWLWNNRFGNLPEAGGAWTPGETKTFCLDLDALPVGNTAATTSVLSSLASGELSIFVQDDTGIDYVLLNIMVCPCEFALPFTVQAEKPDGYFLPDTEPASPSADMLAAFAFPRRGFDYRTSASNFVPSDRWFGHTFTGLPSNIVGAQMEIRMKAAGGLSTNDTIQLEFLNPGFAWGHKINTLTPTSGTANPWNSTKDKVFILDLDSLPPSVPGVTSVLGQLSDGEFDVFVQDDTAIDYILLRLEICCDESIPGDINHSGGVDIIDVGILSEHWLLP